MCRSCGRFRAGCTQWLEKRPYDALGRLLSATAPEWGDESQVNGTTNYGYDEAGNLTSRTDPRGTITTLRYNIRSQIRTKSYTAGTDTAATPDVAYCYDGDVTGGCAGGPSGANMLGRLTQVVSSASTMKYSEFDDLGRVVRSQHRLNGQDYPFSYAYNDVAMTSLTYPSLRVVNYAYDGAGRILSVSGQKGGVPATYVQNVSYTPHGAMDVLTLASGRYEKRCYITGGWR